MTLLRRPALSTRQARNLYLLATDEACEGTDRSGQGANGRFGKAEPLLVCANLGRTALRARNLPSTAMWLIAVNVAVGEATGTGNRLQKVETGLGLRCVLAEDQVFATARPALGVQEHRALFFQL